jgi:hypothetical protein
MGDAVFDGDDGASQPHRLQGGKLPLHGYRGERLAQCLAVR